VDYSEFKNAKKKSDNEESSANRKQIRYEKIKEAPTFQSRIKITRFSRDAFRKTPQFPTSDRGLQEMRSGGKRGRSLTARAVPPHLVEVLLRTRRNARLRCPA
jgi:hypothetical protein